MADIIVYDVLQTADTLTNSVKKTFQLTDYEESGNLSLAGGSSEEIGGATYRVENGDFPVVDSAADGVAFVYVEEDGLNPGTATAELLNTAPSFDSNLGGYYNGAAKAVFALVKTGAIYSKKIYINTTNLNSVLFESYISGIATSSATYFQALTLDILMPGRYRLGYRSRRFFISEGSGSNLSADCTLSFDGANEDDNRMTSTLSFSYNETFSKSIGVPISNDKIIDITSVPTTCYLLIKLNNGDTCSVTDAYIEAEKL